MSLPNMTQPTDYIDHNNHNNHNNDPPPHPYQHYPYYEELMRLFDFLRLYYIPETSYIQYVHRYLSKYSPTLIIMSGLGVLTNVINLAVFYRQGILSDSCTLTITALAFSDFALCLFGFLTGTLVLLLMAVDTNGPETTIVYFEYMRVRPGPSRHVPGMEYILGMASVPFRRFNGWVTAYLSFERMVSVAFPFKVRTIFNSKRSCVSVVALLMFSVLTDLPQYLSEVPIVVPVDNRGTRALRYIQTGLVPRVIVNMFMFVNTFILDSLCQVIIVTCNIVIVIKIAHSRRFRKSRSSSTALGNNSKSDLNSEDKKPKGKRDEPVNAKAVSANKNSSNTKNRGRRETRLIQMMFLLSATFLTSRLPNTISSVFLTIEHLISKYWSPRLFYYSKYFHITTERLNEFLIYVNAATNIFIYFTLSTKYKQIFAEMFSCCKNRQKKK